MDTSRCGMIAVLSDSLRDDPSVYAMWLEGVDAHCLADEYSDIDIWLDVEDGSVKDVLESIRAMLSASGPLDYDCEGENPHPRIRQHFFHIEGTPVGKLLRGFLSGRDSDQVRAGRRAVQRDH